ncbi:hypothetical protein [Aquamicrobium sp. LC103]|uniref:hypothetical protein n=1 Tax=Aquamicrobium sp. LC103 TaxID=1120658 RepID=UPI000A64C6F7|nr:hypothetical protein [Aquamicrobium sp. LC103]
MTIIAFLTGLVLGGLTVGWAASQQIREVKAEALRLISAKHSIDLSVEDAARQVEV